MRWLILLLIVVPFVEVTILVRLGDELGWRLTVLFILVTGVLGVALVRHQGLKAWRRVSDDLSMGVMPAQSIGDAVLILLAGVLMITPGILTDLLGLALLIPWVRRFVRKTAAHRAHRLRVRTMVHSASNHEGGFVDVEAIASRDAQQPVAEVDPTGPLNDDGRPVRQLEG